MTYTIIMRNRNLITSIRGDKEQVRHIVLTLLALDWTVSHVTKRGAL